MFCVYVGRIYVHVLLFLETESDSFNGFCLRTAGKEDPEKQGKPHQEEAGAKQTRPGSKNEEKGRAGLCTEKRQSILSRWNWGKDLISWDRIIRN